MPYLGKSPSSGVRTRFVYAATSGQTSFSGNDSAGISLAYDDNLYLDVYQNGVLLKPVTDYAATTGTSVVLTTGATTDDVVEMIVYDTFAVADTVSAKDGGSFGGSIAVTGLTTTGDINFGDNDKAIFGAGNDLQIYHDGSASRIVDAGTGGLTLQADANVVIQNSAGTETKAEFTTDGGVNLYYDTALKLATTSSGVDITGGFTATAASTITTTGNEVQLTLKSTDADAVEGPTLDLIRDSASPAAADNIGLIRFLGDDSAGNNTVYAEIHGQIENPANGSEDAAINFEITKGSSRDNSFKIGADEVVVNDASRDVDFRVEGATNANLLTVDAGDEAVRINTTATAPGSGNTNAGMEFREAGIAFFSSASGYVNINRNGDGGLIYLNNSGNANGIIGSFDSGQNLFIGSGDTGVTFNPNVDGVLPHNPTTNAQRDNAIDLGYSSVRYDDIYATNGTIQTSDQNEKQNIASLTSAEITAAKAISALFKTFKWKDKVTAKGDAARTHTGVIAQEVQAAMSAAGLDATNYAFWCSNTWWETTTEMAAVEADEDKGIKAIPAHTRTDTYHTESETPEGATKHTRLGVRYPELLAFIGAATEQRLADIETRLAALEA